MDATAVQQWHWPPGKAIHAVEPVSPCVPAALWHLNLARPPQVSQREVHQIKHNIHMTLIAVVHAAHA